LAHRLGRAKFGLTAHVALTLVDGRSRAEAGDAGPEPRVAS
jgi:hypothetical protein